MHDAIPMSHADERGHEPLGARQRSLVDRAHGRISVGTPAPRPGDGYIARVTARDPDGVDFAALFAALPGAICVLDRELRYVAANPAYLALLGATWDHLAGRTMLEVFPDDPGAPNTASAVMLRASLSRVVETGQPDELAFIPYRVSRTPGGPAEVRYWSATHTPLRGPDGHARFVIAQTHDVTELHERGDASPPGLAHGVLDRASRVQAAHRLVSAELAELRRLFEQAPGFVCFLRGPEHRFELANASYLALIGKDRAIIGKPVLDALPEVHGQGFLEILDRVFGTGEAFVGRGVRIELARGPGQAREARVLDFVYQPILGPDGRAVGIFVQGHDLTEQRLAETARARLAEEHRVLVEMLPQQVWTANIEGLLTSINAQGTRYFGAPREAIIGAGWKDVVHPDDLPVALEAWARSLATGVPYEMEFRLRAGDGSYRWHLARATALRGDAGAIAQWLGTNTDIDEARRTHDELRARADYEAQLIGIVSHDLRNPLSTISISASLLESAALDAGGQRIVGHIANATARAGQLITDLLDFAQARSGSFPISPGPTNLAVLVRRAVDDAKLLGGERSATYTHTGPEVGSWDEGRIMQLIGNLVGNAFQHAPAGAAIAVRTGIAGDRTTLEVFNEGPPIADHDQTRLFEPFARGRSARTQRGRSVGLGLFIANKIVAAHRGTLTVRSVAGEGTTFTVTLPTRVAL